MNIGINSCQRCGTCCQKGGPAFHLEDRDLIDKGVIHTRNLYTIRIGEMVHDNVHDLLMPSNAEMIKLKGREASWTCIFYNDATCQCGIYEHRPRECRELKCWDTSALETMYDKNRLTREHLLSDIAGLWDLVQGHEKQCGYEKLKLSIDDVDGRFGQTAIKTAVGMVRYDQEIRRMVISQGGIEPDMLEFLFGRPLEKTIEGFGYKIRNRNGRYQLVRR